MRLQSVWVLLLIMVAAATAFGQRREPRWEVYGGYQYTRMGAGFVQDEYNVATQGTPAISVNKQQSLNGWNAGGQVNVARWFSVVADFGGAYGTRSASFTATGISGGSVRTKASQYTLMGGPQFSFGGSSRVRPYFRGLFGKAYLYNTLNAFGNNAAIVSQLKESDDRFAFGGGGGVNIGVTQHWGLRVGADFLRTKFFDKIIGKETQNNMRGSVVLVYRFGGGGR